MTTLKAKMRDSNESLDQIRKNGDIPAVFYGFKKDTTSISVSEKDFKKAFKVAGESSAIVLETPNGNLDVMIHDVAFNPVNGFPIHADFLVIDTNKEIEVSVPLEFIGEAPAVKGNLGSLVKVIHEIEITALPKNLPHGIEVDVSSLANVNDQIHVKDLKIPSGVTLVTDPEEVVALIAEMKEEVEDTTPVDLSAIEVSVEKGKKEEEAPAEEKKEE
jgi:large subunit ribosomal protein L25